MIDDITRLCAQIAERLLARYQPDRVQVHDLFKAVVKSDLRLQEHMKSDVNALTQRFTFALKILEKAGFISYHETYLIYLKRTNTATTPMKVPNPIEAVPTHETPTKRISAEVSSVSTFAPASSTPPTPPTPPTPLTPPTP